MNFEEGTTLCGKDMDGIMAVPNSDSEAVFLYDYLKGLAVRFVLFCLVFESNKSVVCFSGIWLWKHYNTFSWNTWWLFPSCSRSPICGVL